MFTQLISLFIPIVENLIETILEHDILAYVFYLGILGLVLSVIRYIISFSNADIDLDMRSDEPSYSSRSLPKVYMPPHNYKALPKYNYPKKR